MILKTENQNKVDQTKNSFFEKSNKRDKPITRLLKKKKKDTNYHY